MFVLIAQADFLLEGGGPALIESWRAVGKSVEFHLIASGGHGFGYGRPGTASKGRLPMLHHWLDTLELLKPRALAFGGWHVS